jgi:membrane protein YqaA with SNARE-associated domain
LKRTDLDYERFSKHVDSPWSLVIGFLWGLAEATVFFIVPDVYLGFVALCNWRRGLWVMLAAFLGAMLGGAAMYLLATNNPSGVDRFLTHIPMIDAPLVAEVAEQTRTQGLMAVLFGPLRGTPYKIYAAQAGAQSLPLLSFLLMTIPARLQRFIPVVLSLGAVGTWLRAFCEKHTKLVLAAYILLWGIIYFMFITYFGFH